MVIRRPPYNRFVQKTTVRNSIIRVALTTGKGGSRKTERVALTTRTGCSLRPEYSPWINPWIHPWAPKNERTENSPAGNAINADNSFFMLRGLRRSLRQQVGPPTVVPVLPGGYSHAPPIVPASEKFPLFS